MKKLAAVYERKGVIYVLAAHKTQAGFWIDDDEVLRLVQPTPGELGHAIEVALARSKDSVSTPPPTARIDQPLLNAAGVGSWATFMKLSRHVSVSNDDGMVTATSYRNLGSKQGFEPDGHTTIPAPSSSSALGHVVTEIMSRQS